MDDQNNPGGGVPTVPTDQGGQTPPADQPAEAPVTQYGEKCVTCGNQASGGNCVACGQGAVSCTCTPSGGGQEPGSQPSAGGMV